MVNLGIDLGGTKIDIGLVDSSGKILHRELIKTSKAGAETVVHDILHAITTLQHRDHPIQSIGIGMAGQIDAQTGTVLFAPNLGWRDFPLGKAIESALRLPVHITNDVRAAAYGEWLYGAGKGCQDLICLFIGTGIGSGIVSGGRMLTGSSNSAGEVGHMTLDLHGPLCGCGNKGCFEALASGSAIARRAKELISYDSTDGKKLLDLIGSDAETITARHIFEAYRFHSPIAVRVVEEVKETLIAGVAGLVNAFNPQKVILGGGVITGFPELIEVIRSGIPKRALKVAVEHLEVVQGQLKGDAGVVGAAAFTQKL
jgi:glucokinase